MKHTIEIGEEKFDIDIEVCKDLIHVNGIIPDYIVEKYNLDCNIIQEYTVTSVINSVKNKIIEIINKEYEDELIIRYEFTRNSFPLYDEDENLDVREFKDKPKFNIFIPWGNGVRVAIFIKRIFKTGKIYYVRPSKIDDYYGGKIQNLGMQVLAGAKEMPYTPERAKMFFEILREIDNRIDIDWFEEFVNSRKDSKYELQK